jgi:hypothetical protein
MDHVTSFLDYQASGAVSNEAALLAKEILMADTKLV